MHSCYSSHHIHTHTATIILDEVDTAQSGRGSCSPLTRQIIPPLACNHCHNIAEEANLLLRYLYGYKLLQGIALDNGNNNSLIIMENKQCNKKNSHFPLYYSHIILWVRFLRNLACSFLPFISTWNLLFHSSQVIATFLECCWVYWCIILQISTAYRLSSVVQIIVIELFWSNDGWLDCNFYEGFMLQVKFFWDFWISADYNYSIVYIYI